MGGAEVIYTLEGMSNIGGLVPMALWGRTLL